LESGVDYSIVNGTKGTDDFYSSYHYSKLNQLLFYPRLYHNYNICLLDMIGGTLCQQLEA
jgi:hypothetical protein